MPEMMQPGSVPVQAPPKEDKSVGRSVGIRVLFASHTIQPQPQPAESQPAEPLPVEPPAAEPLPVEPPAAEPLPVEPPAESPLVEPPPQHPQQPDAPDEPDAVADQPAPIIVTTVPGGVMIACEDLDALDDFEDLLTTLAGNLTSGGPELTIFYLVHAKAAAVAETLDQILGGGTIASEGGGGGGGLIGDIAGAALGGSGGGILGSLLGLGGGGGTIAPSGSIKITPDSRLNALIVQANPADLDMVEQLLKVLDQKGSPEDVLVVSKAKIIPVFNTQAQEIADILKQVYQNRMVTSAKGGRQPSPEDLIRALRGGRSRGGSKSGSAEEEQKMSIGIDTRTNSIIVAAPEPLLEEVEQLVEQLDLAALDSNDQSVRIVTLHQASPEAVQRALSSMMGDAVQIGGSSTSSSRRQRTSTGRPSSQPSDPRRAFFMEMMRRRFEGRGGSPGGSPGGQPPRGRQPGGSPRPMQPQPMQLRR
jgi:hypothetical protein